MRIVVTSARWDPRLNTTLPLTIEITSDPARAVRGLREYLHDAVVLDESRLTPPQKDTLLSIATSRPALAVWEPHDQGRFTLLAHLSGRYTGEPGGSRAANGNLQDIHWCWQRAMGRWIQDSMFGHLPPTVTPLLQRVLQTVGGGGSVDQVATALGCTARTLNGYLQRCRIKRLKTLDLLMRSVRAWEVARQGMGMERAALILGYSTASTLIRAIKATTGFTPKQLGVLTDEEVVHLVGTLAQRDGPDSAHSPDDRHRQTKPRAAAAGW